MPGKSFRSQQKRQPIGKCSTCADRLVEPGGACDHFVVCTGVAIVGLFAKSAELRIFGGSLALLNALISLGLGIAALVSLRREPRRGTGFAVFAVVISCGCWRGVQPRRGRNAVFPFCRLRAVGCQGCAVWRRLDLVSTSRSQGRRYQKVGVRTSIEDSYRHSRLARRAVVRPDQAAPTDLTHMDPWWDQLRRQADDGCN